MPDMQVRQVELDLGLWRVPQPSTVAV